MTVFVVVLVCAFTLLLSINVYLVFRSEARPYDDGFVTKLESVTKVAEFEGDSMR